MHVGVLRFRVALRETEEAVLIYLSSVVPKMRESSGGFGAGSCCRTPR